MKGFSEQDQFEQYRLSIISAWPESELKRAALASARAALQRELAVTQSRVGVEPVVVRDAT